MRAQRFAVLTVAAASLLAGADNACAQGYPNKPIRIVTSGIGGGADFASRLIAQGLAASLGQQVIVDNRASGAAPGEVVAKSPPDGYTMLLFGATVWLLPFMRNNVPYDPVRDFTPITLAVTAPNILVVHPSLPVRSVKDLMAFAKARPGQLNYSISGSGSSNHLAGELFKAMAGVDILCIPYKGPALALNDLISGQVQLSFATGSVMAQVKAGRLRALAVASAQPSALAPRLPTVAGSGLPGFEAVTMTGLFAPAGTPAAVINRLNEEILRVINRTESKERFFNTGLEVVGTSPQEFGAAIKADMARMGKVIRDVGIRAE